MKIEAVIFDWAGTTVDYGCFAPLEVFMKIFQKRGVEITAAEARKPMGLLKIDHVRALTEMPRIADEWKRVFGQLPTEADIHEMYEEFEEILFSIFRLVPLLTSLLRLNPIINHISLGDEKNSR